MPTLWSPDPKLWSHAVIQHCVLTGHARLQPADNPREGNLSWGIACMEPGCDHLFCITWRDADMGARLLTTSRVMIDHWRGSSPGKQKIIEAMLDAVRSERAYREAHPLKPIERTTAWARLLLDED